MTRNELLIKLFETSTSIDKDYDTADYIVQYITQCYEQDDTEEVDTLFTLISTDCVPTTYLLMILRFTFSSAKSLTQWKDLRDRSIASANERGENVKQLFSGLSDQLVDNYNPSPFIKRLLRIPTKRN